jgi:hypothetical protein
VHPVFDYMLIGGGLSLIVTAIVLRQPWLSQIELVGRPVAYLILLTNSAHFAASSIRLYTKPGTRESLPFLTMAFPLVVFAVLTLCFYQVERLGQHLASLYLTWSPYHYAAQAYGIAVIYSMRSGCSLSARNKQLLWWVSMLPFFHNFISGPQVGVHWLAPAGLISQPTVNFWLTQATLVLPILALLLTAAYFVRVWRTEQVPMPVIAILAVVANGIWFFALSQRGFVWATIFHGLQYLAIVVIFHVKDQLNAVQRGKAGSQDGSASSVRRRAQSHWLYHALWFYGMCILLAYALFSCLPLAYVAVGFGMIESVLLVTATINIHHFIVDAYIWRLKKTDRNRGIVVAPA